MRLRNTRSCQSSPLWAGGRILSRLPQFPREGSVLLTMKHMFQSSMDVHKDFFSSYEFMLHSKNKHDLLYLVRMVTFLFHTTLEINYSVLSWENFLRRLIWFDRAPYRVIYKKGWGSWYGSCKKGAHVGGSVKQCRHFGEQSGGFSQTPTVPPILAQRHLYTQAHCYSTHNS